MKIAITGHTSGLGLSLYNGSKNRGFYTVGFSRKIGFDITDKNSRRKMIELSNDCDVFINNAYDRYGQIDLLYDLYDRWKSQTKTIVTIGSYAANAAEWRLKPCLYSTVKKALDVTTYQLLNSHDRKDCKLMIFKPSYLGDDHDKIPFDYAANYLLDHITDNQYQTVELVLR